MKSSALASRSRAMSRNFFLKAQASVAFACALAFAAFQAVAGTLVLPQGGLRWGQDPVSYSFGGACTGTTVDLRVASTFLSGLDSTLSARLRNGLPGPFVGYGSFPASAACVGGQYQVNVPMELQWYTSNPAVPSQGPSGLPPGMYSLQVEVWGPPNWLGPPTSVTPSVVTQVRFDHPYYFAELSTGVTPVGGAARYVDPSSSPIPLPGVPSPRLIEISSSASSRTLVGMTLPFNVVSSTLWVYDQRPSQPLQWREVGAGDADTLLSGTTAILPIFSSPGYIAFSIPPAAVTPTA